MKLVDEIIHLLSSDKPSLQNALFKAQVLAHHFGDVELKQWVESELKGYSGGAHVPPYRIVPVSLFGIISNGAYRYSDQPLPTHNLDQTLQDKLASIEITQSIAAVEQWAQSDGEVRVELDPIFWGEIGKHLGSGYGVERAWSRFPAGTHEGILTEVRSRLLDFTLNLADRVPRDPEAESMKKVAQDAAVNDLFRNAVFGANTTIMVGNGGVQHVSNSVSKNNMESLLNYLRDQKVPEDDLAGLETAIGQDQGSVEHNDGKLGSRVSNWVGRMVAKAGNGAWQVGLGAAGNILGAALNGFYGF